MDRDPAGRWAIRADLTWAGQTWTVWISPQEANNAAERLRLLAADCWDVHSAAEPTLTGTGTLG